MNAEIIAVFYSQNFKPNLSLVEEEYKERNFCLTQQAWKHSARQRLFDIEQKC